MTPSISPRLANTPNHAVDTANDANPLIRGHGERRLTPGGQFVALSTPPRPGVEFKPLSCGLVSSARTALGLTLPEFAALLESALGWVVMPEAVGRWETGNVPPGDVVPFCQAFLADAHGFPAPDAPGRDGLAARRAARGRQ